MTANLMEEFQEYACPHCSLPPYTQGFTAWFRVNPESAQDLHTEGKDVKNAYEQKIKDEFAKRNFQQVATVGGARYPLNLSDPANVYGKGVKSLDVCVGLFFGLSKKCTDKDVDNMTKLFLDALKGEDGLIDDDRAVTHLEVFKRILVHQAGSEADENYLVGVRVLPVSRTLSRSIPFTWSLSTAVI